ncbi:MAG: hypothetical protein SPI91_00970 [Bacilli bacterium]|jgi:hypothetical protein|nr:hypothetical protein [Bacilli bacterium]
MEIKEYKKLRLCNLDELSRASDCIGYCIGALLDLELFIPLKDKRRYKITYKFLEDLYDEIDKAYIMLTDN